MVVPYSQHRLIRSDHDTSGRRDEIRRLITSWQELSRQGARNAATGPQFRQRWRKAFFKQHGPHDLMLSRHVGSSRNGLWVNGMAMLVRSSALAAGVIALSAGLAGAESVPFACEMQPDQKTIRIVLSNPAQRTRSCIASCQFQTPLYGGEVQIICAHPVAADAKDIEMCTRDSGGQQLIKQTFGSADCYNY